MRRLRAAHPIELTSALSSGPSQGTSRLLWPLAPPLVLRGPEGLGKPRRCREVAPPIGGYGVAPVALLFTSDLRRSDETRSRREA
jgi:hypothetical protein